MKKYFSEFGEKPERSIPSESTVRDTDLAYLAGIIDGEGSLTFTQIGNRRQKFKCPYARLTIANSNLILLDKCLKVLEAIVGHSLKLNKKSFYSKAIVKSNLQGWTISVGSHKDLEKVLSLIEPYLVAKQQQLKNVLLFVRLRAKDGYFYSHGTREFLKSIGIERVETEREAPVKPDEATVRPIQECIEAGRNDLPLLKIAK